MKKIKPVIVLLAAIIFLYPAPVSAIAQYQEINTSQGKVIVGLDREKAYQMFGAPASKGGGLWYYAGPPAFFVNFSENHPDILLYPNSCQATVDIPLEFKAFLSLPDSAITDITKEVQLVFDWPECARVVDTGVIIPKKAGKYSALAVYKDVLSNPLHLQIKEARGIEQKEKEKLLSIDLLPYQPTVPLEGIINFVALGTFFDYDLNEYSVRDLSQEAVWFMRQRPNLTWNKEDSYRLYFLKKGQVEVLSKYKETESFLQRVEIKDKVDPGVKRLKHILVLPEMMIVLLNSNLNMRAFGTYYDNSVVELTQDVKWKINDPEILESNKNGYFYAKAEGITEVIATKDGVEGLLIKVAVVNKSAHFINAGLSVNSSKENALNRNTLEAIKADVEQLKKDFLVKKKELRNIQITPKSLEISLGEEGKLLATGFYNDGSSSDLTILGNWGILNKDIAIVSGGNVASVSAGQTSAYVEFQGVRSEYAKVVVGGARLVSLLLTPQSLRIPRNGKANLKVQGNYYDHSQRDLTGQVNWGIEGLQVVKIENGVLRPLRFGQSKVYAEYSRLKSNTSSIDVILTLGWLLWLLAKIILVLLLGIFFAIFILYLFAQNKRRQLRLLRDKPREFILGLHENAIRLITIFGLRYDAYTFPLFYAELAKQKFLLKDNVFLNFSIKFEEAKYSQHVLQNSDVVAAVDDYNNFFDKLCKSQSRLRFYSRYCLALIHRRPIFIFSPLEVSAQK
ncbi:MAG: hypothetical protein Q8N62_08410 [Candidatus Omnitrophota bacterium]|nr:hypothetical protein [Candidatus Omnitrophota bacterium]